VLGVAPKFFIYTECKLSNKVHTFIWGGLRGGMRLFGVASATPCHPGRTATAFKKNKVTKMVYFTYSPRSSTYPIVTKFGLGHIFWT